MRLPIILDGLGLILAIFSVSFLGPIWTGVWYDEDPYRLFLSYGIPIIISLTLGLGLRAFMHEKYEQIRSGEALVLVSLAWLAIAIIGAIPYMGMGVVDSALDAYFESMSGFTSTGASILSGLDSTAKSILLWRALTQWIGGMGVIVLSVAVLSRFFGGGASILLMRGEVSGHMVTRMAPRMVQTARLLWGIYVMFTVLEVMLLMVAGRFTEPRMTLFDAVCQSFATLPGGGFGTHDASIGYWRSPLIETIVIVFMMAGATSFVLHHQALRLNFRAYLKDPEFRFWIMVILFAVVFITGDLSVRGIYSINESIRYSSFSVVSLITTTGFATADFASWPIGSQVMLLVLILMGGMMGSTSGALKMTRVMIILKSIRVLIYRTMHPHAVIKVRLGNVTITDENVNNTLTYVMLYMVIIAVGTMLVGMSGVDLVSALSANITCIGTTGPGLGVVGPATNYAVLPGFAKLVLTFVMWLGRLEILGCLLLLNPWTLRE